ncbi:MAG: beta-ketoacyl-ACP synthase II [Saprospiraceae bacterium]|jgi:3-oxoacyl-[acyl-carrier-protein] synthase II|uniref:3-oxoacyl-[acyl-carrier-protein] synthase 2 n=1 Tax=Candidatus Defluviibacterium haderslevense TaxID=2981993 RepID=A0A9D7XD66_9BACT|nr:beta-ketoacyl-ACP synthase II [Candidatus Defluviibacterium haderslevense]MBK9716305.1 beta-ketoacyl-ACP synthase II [Candidatus Defluviibacterium haderslevense]MBL0238648.1 beta-ketoacyl-ACP synthase II [Candidatus Defluviibacterium haderslevense]MCI1266683.1 beta-ketoacyl-ACP synthase II [Saprospiraceae bacterium]
MRRVVVTGIGVLSPIGNNQQDFLNGLQHGISGAGLITRFDASLFKTRFACELKNFNPEDFLDRKEARKLDPFAQYALVVAEEAMKDSGIELEKVNRMKFGVIWGSGIGGFYTLETDISEAALLTGPPRYSPFLIPKLISDIAPGHISIKYGLMGINYGTVSACASSSHAISNAYDYIKYGKANLILTGGSEAAITRAGVGGFSSMKALSERNDDFSTASRPYDRDRDGFVLGEGAGALILEEYEHAKARGAKIYAEIVGTGLSADAYHITAPHPDGIGAKAAMELALEEANMNPDQIDYINTHGTSTPLGDIAEVKAIQHVFGEDVYKLNISSTKSMTGHLLGAAGAIESIAGILGMNHHFVPPTINHVTDDPALDPKLNFTFNEAQEKVINAFISNTFGFGGHNSSVIFKRC